jgi:hypothetical protein
LKLKKQQEEQFKKVLNNQSNGQKHQARLSILPNRRITNMNKSPTFTEIGQVHDHQKSESSSQSESSPSDKEKYESFSSETSCGKKSESEEDKEDFENINSSDSKYS